MHIAFGCGKNPVVGFIESKYPFFESAIIAEDAVSNDHLLDSIPNIFEDAVVFLHCGSSFDELTIPFDSNLDFNADILDSLSARNLGDFKLAVLAALGVSMQLFGVMQFLGVLLIVLAF